MSNLNLDLSKLATAMLIPWSERKYPEHDNDPRGCFQRDRDRILHSDSFRKLQYKTQVFVVHEGDFFRTRLTHTLEVSQIGRTLATIFNLNEPLVEAICLAHDLGHSPFGHEGEEALAKCLGNDENETSKDQKNKDKRRKRDSTKSQNLKWNSNIHSLTVVEESEIQYFAHPGLNLTWATREGIARHSTNFDKPYEGAEYNQYQQPSLEAQIANIADTIAYCSHDMEDALISRIISIDDLSTLNNPLWNDCYKRAKKESRCANDYGSDEQRLLIKRVHRHMIDLLIRKLFHYTKKHYKDKRIETIDEMRDLNLPLISFDDETGSLINKFTRFMLDYVYKSPLVAGQNYRANLVISSLFRALKEDNHLLPFSVQKRITEGKNASMEIAQFIAGLTDRSSTDLYAELFEPSARSMGHFIR